MTPDIALDFMRADLAGHVTVRANKLPADIEANDCVVVGDDDAESAVARVLEIADGRAALRILAGTVEDNRDLLVKHPVSTAG